MRNLHIYLYIIIFTYIKKHINEEVLQHVNQSLTGSQDVLTVFGREGWLEDPPIGWGGKRFHDQTTGGP